MSDNPFAEPDDDRTVIRPVPGGRRRPAAAPATKPAPLPQPDLTAPAAFRTSQLTIAASPLLQLLIQLSATRRPPDLRALRERVVQDLRTFERRVREAGVPMDLLRPAHYALCASIDDVVLNSPWGAASGWAKQTLVASFHHGARGSDQFFDQLRQLWTAPRRFLPVTELMYFCLSLGFMGRYRQARGEGELDRIRAATHAAITAQRQSAEPELSRRWRGIAVPRQAARHRFPVWVALAGAVVLSGALFLWTSTSLNAASDGLRAQALTTPPTRMPRLARAAAVQPLPPPPAAPEPTTLDRLRASLQPDIDRGTVSLLGTPATPVIRVAGHSMFALGSAEVQQASYVLLEHIAAALHNETGMLLVIDYTDNQRVRSVRFPSNFQLSLARANAVRVIIARSLGDPVRISAEGRADADPIASNATSEGREQNQRVEIVLYRQD